MIGRIEGEAAASQADAIGKQLDELVGAAQDLRPVWPEVGEVFAERQKQVFSTGSFGRWAPLRVSTMMKKASTSISPSTALVDSGLLRNATTSARAVVSTEQRAEFGVPSGDPVRQYAQYHIRGAGVPQRQPIPKFTPTERRRLIEKIQNHIRKAID